MKRRGFLRNILMMPFSGLMANVLWETLQEGVTPPVTIKSLPCPELLGYKGDQFLETGYIFAPYIPLVTATTYMSPKFVKRFAKTKINYKYYGRG